MMFYSRPIDFLVEFKGAEHSGCGRKVTASLSSWFFGRFWGFGSFGVHVISWKTVWKPG